jgi:hypothetical protein
MIAAKCTWKYEQRGAEGLNLAIAIHEVENFVPQGPRRVHSVRNRSVADTVAAPGSPRAPPCCALPTVPLPSSAPSSRTPPSAPPGLSHSLILARRDAIEGSNSQFSASSPLISSSPNEEAEFFESFRATEGVLESPSRTSLRSAQGLDAPALLRSVPYVRISRPLPILLDTRAAWP